MVGVGTCKCYAHANTKWDSYLQCVCDASFECRPFPSPLATDGAGHSWRFTPKNVYGIPGTSRQSLNMRFSVISTSIVSEPANYGIRNSWYITQLQGIENWNSGCFVRMCVLCVGNSPRLSR